MSFSQSVTKAVDAVVEKYISAIATKYDLPKDLHEDLKVDPDMTRILNLWY